MKPKTGRSRSCLAGLGTLRGRLVDMIGEVDEPSFGPATTSFSFFASSWLRSK